MLDWLEAQPGETRQQRWLASGAEASGAGCRQVPLRWLGDHGRRSQCPQGVVCVDLVRPSLGRLVSVPSVKGDLAHELVHRVILTAVLAALIVNTTRQQRKQAALVEREGSAPATV
jgi:hypothetical protein